MRRARPCPLLALLVVAGCGGGEPPHPYIENEPPQQVVLITVGALRPDHLRTYGYGPKRNPPDALRRDISSLRIDQIFARYEGEPKGVVFENCQASSSQTAPSLATVLTGLIPAKHGVLANGQRLADSVPNMASLFGEAGYETAAFLGVKHLESLAGDFDEVVAEHTYAANVRRAAVAWVNNRRQSDRFFMWVHFNDVRDWWMAYNPSRWTNYADFEDYVRNFTKARSKQLYGYFAHLHGLPDPRLGFEPVDYGWRPDRAGLTARFDAQGEGDMLDWFDRYDARIAAVDLEVFALLGALRDAELPGEKLYVFTSDHGEALGDHEYVGHDKHLYEAQLRVPLMLRFSGPGRPAGRVEQQVRHTDLFFTMAQMLGRDLDDFHAQPDGESLWPLLPGAPAADEQEPRVAYAQRQPVDELRRELGWSDEAVWSVRTPEFRFIDREQGPDELYRMIGRTREGMDLAGKGHPAEAALRELLEERRAWLDAHADELPSGGEPDPAWERELVRLGERL